LYFLVIYLFAMKLSKVVADLSSRVELVSLHDHVPHLSPDVGCGVVALHESRPVNLLVSPTPNESCKSSLGLGVTIEGIRNVAICDGLGCRGAGSPFLGNFLGGAICASDAGNEVKT
jgi:hypothetical protein